VEWRLGRLPAADLERLARERSWDPLVLYQAGRVRQRGGDHAGAAALLARAAGADPDYAPAHRALGLSLAALGRKEAAEVALRRALQLAPGDGLARLALADLYRGVGAVNEAIGLLEERLRQAPRDAAALYRLAECYSDRGQPDRRRALLEQAVAAAPENPRYRVALGQALFFYGRRADGERHFRAALAARPQDPESLYRWGRTLADHGDDTRLAEAGRALEQSAHLRPRHADTRMALGQVHLRRGDLEAARAALLTATRIGQFEDRTLLLLGQTYLRLGRQAEGEQALAAYRRATDRSRTIVHLEHRLHNTPGDATARARLARLYDADDQPERARYHRGLLQTAGRGEKKDGRSVAPADPNP
jgi:tetratricopeptide (TPR) repeat protein